VRVLLLSAAIVVADQATKLWVKGGSLFGCSWAGIPPGDHVPLLGDLLRLTYVENPGMAFGIDVGGKLLLSLFSLLATIAIAWYLHRIRTEPLPFRLALAMILGGAAGNLIDRAFYGVWFQGENLFYGRVIDFVDFDFPDISFFDYHLTRWPVFNVADAAVTVGVVLLLFFYRAPAAESSGPTPGAE
jgi:signal peptidase II